MQKIRSEKKIQNEFEKLVALEIQILGYTLGSKSQLM